MLETKLDRFTAVALAHEMVDLVDATKFSDILELNCIARLLPRAPKWNARKRQLDFTIPAPGIACSRLSIVQCRSVSQIMFK